MPLLSWAEDHIWAESSSSEQSPFLRTAEASGLASDVRPLQWSEHCRAVSSIQCYQKGFLQIPAVQDFSLHQVLKAGVVAPLATAMT